MSPQVNNKRFTFSELLQDDSIDDAFSKNRTVSPENAPLEIIEDKPESAEEMEPDAEIDQETDSFEPLTELETVTDLVKCIYFNHEIINLAKYHEFSINKYFR